MAIGVDTSKWKPRKVAGTPAAKFRNRLAIGVIGVGMLFGSYFHFASITQKLREAISNLYEDPIEEVERRLLIASGLPVRSGDQLRQMLEDMNRVDQPDK